MTVYSTILSRRDAIDFLLESAESDESSYIDRRTLESKTDRELTDIIREELELGEGLAECINGWYHSSDWCNDTWEVELRR
jgi:hypothetical protein